MKVTNLKRIALTAGAFICSLGLTAQDGQAIFKQNCGACHTVGKGKLVGPDLAGVNTKRSAEWITSFVKNAEAFGQKDADAKAIIQEYGYPMPPQSVSDGDIATIIDYIAANSGGGDEAAEEVVEEPRDPALDPANASEEVIAAGRDLFVGATRFAEGGPSCLTCHNVDQKGVMTGGALAKDLTKVYERMGEAGIRGILTAPPFPAMTSSYKDDPLTDEEITQLTAFFANAVDAPAQGEEDSKSIVAGGFAAFVVIAIIIFLLFNKRKKGSVKDDIYAR